MRRLEKDSVSSSSPHTYPFKHRVWKIEVCNMSLLSSSVRLQRGHKWEPERTRQGQSEDSLSVKASLSSVRCFPGKIRVEIETCLLKPMQKQLTRVNKREEKRSQGSRGWKVMDWLNWTSSPSVEGAFIVRTVPIASRKQIYSGPAADSQDPV